MSSRLFLLALAFALSSMVAVASDPYYKYEVNVESHESRLLYLAEYDLGDDGYFEIKLDLKLAIGLYAGQQGRTMLYLLACDAEATRSFQYDQIASASSSLIPSYCVMPNRTLDYYCQSFPLENEAPDVSDYRSFKTISGSMNDPTAQPQYSRDATHSNSTSTNTTTVFFFIDTCETLGGEDGILRSCLASPPGSSLLVPSDSSDQKTSLCFFCPKNYPSSDSIAEVAEAEGCVISPALPHTLSGVVSMNLCTANGECLDDTSAFLARFYGASSIVWGVTSFVWIAHIHTAARDAVVELQHRMKLVPLSQLLYSVCTCMALYTADSLVGSAYSVVQNCAILAQFLALAVSAEVVVLIAKGWKITRPALHARETQWIRLVTLLWAASFVMLTHSDEKQMAIVIVWGISWACVVFMVWHNTNFNISMLKYQIAMMRHLDLDPHNTPVYTKFMLFSRFRGLLAAYIFASCIFGIVGLVNDAAHVTWEWSSVVADEGITYLLFVALGYTFRCRRFSRLQVNVDHQDPSQGEGVTPAQQEGHGHRSSIAPEPVPLEPAGPAESPKRKKTIVVLNPDHAQWLGTAYGPAEHTVEPAIVAKSSVSPS
ncbi:hypothetical protein BBJ28_00006518 [Nothophytophthora sp. Chile5]|nr:hypothetical protein BBJ28_00006518 [Nothophytophthora sp. Chile5]